MEENWTEATQPIPLESVPPLQPVNEGREIEKTRYWNSILTGNPDTVPDAVRRKAGVADVSSPAEERDHRLMSNINRSWVVDHRGKQRREVMADWKMHRSALAQELGVADDEREVFMALSAREGEAALREKARRVYEGAFFAGLHGEQLPLCRRPQDARNLARSSRRFIASASE